MVKMIQIRTAEKTAKAAVKRENAIRDLIKNRKAFHDYTIITAYEAGIELRGTEVKACRAAHIAMTDAYARILNGEITMLNVNISPYDHGNRFNHDPTRPRRLLLHKAEIRKIAGMIREKGYTLIPLRIYLKNGKIKVELGICKGKVAGDKRETLKQRQHDIETRRTIAHFAHSV